jgi:hypothetical protein
LKNSGVDDQEGKNSSTEERSYNDDVAVDDDVSII